MSAEQIRVKKIPSSLFLFLFLFLFLCPPIILNSKPHVFYHSSQLSSSNLPYANNFFPSSLIPQISMEDYRSNPNGFNTETHYATNPRNSYELRPYSASYAQTQIEFKESQFKKGKSASGSVSKSRGLSDPEFQRKKRVASYKMYSVEGKMKGSFRNSFRWLKRKCEQVVYGWW